MSFIASAQFDLCVRLHLSLNTIISITVISIAIISITVISITIISIAIISITIISIILILTAMTIITFLWAVCGIAPNNNNDRP